MKTALAISAVVIAAVGDLHAQGSVTFSNIGSPVSSSPYVFLLTDAGTTFVPTGPQFRAELMFAPDGTPMDAFDALAIRVGATTSFGPVPGIFAGGNRTAAAITPAGGYGLFQVRVWETAGGLDYRSAVAGGNPNIRVGTSLILRVDTADPTTLPPGIPTTLIAAGLQSFTLTPVPEPSTIAAALLGAGCLLLRYWCKQRNDL